MVRLKVGLEKGGNVKVVKFQFLDGAIKSRLGFKKNILNFKRS